jgi:hypothetical protein
MQRHPAGMMNDHERLASELKRLILDPPTIQEGVPNGPDWKQRIILGKFESWLLNQVDFYAGELIHDIPLIEKSCVSATNAVKRVSDNRKMKLNEARLVMKTIRRLIETPFHIDERDSADC